MAQKTGQTQQLIPAYLVVGEDQLKRQAVIKRLRSRIAALGELEFNHDVFDGEVATGLDIVSACDTMPFMSELRLVEVENAEKLKKADSEALVSYLADPNETTVLALVSEKLAKNTRLYKAVASVGKQAVIECVPKTRRELPRMVREMAVGHGVTFSDKAASALIELVGENTVALDGAIRKIALAHMGKGAVSDAEVRNLVARVAEVKPWDFVDAVSARNLPLALSLLGKMSSTSPHSLIGMCTKRIRELMCAKALDDRGQLGALPKALKLPDWRVKNYPAWSKGFTQSELRQALKSAREAERLMKSGTDANDAFLQWVIAVVPRK